VGSEIARKHHSEYQVDERKNERMKEERQRRDTPFFTFDIFISLTPMVHNDLTLQSRGVRVIVFGHLLWLDN
jgi:hypothetical protein